MSGEISSVSVTRPDEAGQAARRAALRLAFAVTACFVIVEMLRLEAGYLAPILATMMLATNPQAPSFAQGVSQMVVVLLSLGVAAAISAAFFVQPTVLILAVGLMLYLSFYALLRGAPGSAIVLVQLSVVLFPFYNVASPHAASTFATTLTKAMFVALLTVWAAHAAFPEPAEAETGSKPPKNIPPEPGTVARQALLRTFVMMPPITWYVLQASQNLSNGKTFLISLIVLMRSADARQGQRAALNRVVGTAIGGVAAVIVYNLLLTNTTFLFFICVYLATSLLFAGQIVSSGDRAPLYILAFWTFILLLGKGVTYEGGSGQAFGDRLQMVFLAAIYVVGAASVVEKWRSD
jgi:hypothetical protein